MNRRSFLAMLAGAVPALSALSSLSSLSSRDVPAVPAPPAPQGPYTINWDAVQRTVSRKYTAQVDRMIFSPSEFHELQRRMKP